jgi:hypothetical protein
MRSNASLKSIVNRHTDSLYISVYAIMSRIAATASNTAFPCLPQYWLGCNMSLIQGRSLFVIIRVRSLWSACSSLRGL